MLLRWSHPHSDLGSTPFPHDASEAHPSLSGSLSRVWLGCVTAELRRLTIEAMRPPNVGDPRFS